jgi:hypothetical protein
VQDQFVALVLAFGGRHLVGVAAYGTHGTPFRRRKWRRRARRATAGELRFRSWHRRLYSFGVTGRGGRL